MQTLMELNEKQLDALKEIGNEWQKGNHHRIYINNLESRVGLKISRYNSGNISYAELNGEKISNSSANKIIARLTSVKVYYDINEKTLVIQNSEKLYAEEIEAITESIINEMNELVGEEVEETELSNNNQINEGDLTTQENWYEVAKNRVEDSEALAPHADYIGTSNGNDWGVGDDHWRWVATAPEKEIVNWVDAGQ